MTVFIVGQYRGEGERWELFQGVFSTRERAIEACRDATYFVGPAELDAEIPHERADWPGAFYPAAAEAGHAT